MNDLIETKEYKGYTIGISYDSDPMHPRNDWDNLGTMVTSHRRYNMGDTQTSDLEEYMADLAQYDSEYAYNYAIPLNQSVKRLQKTHIVLPVYMYDHSGISLSTGPFSCGWDSSLLGFIYISKEDAKKEFGKSKNYLQKARKMLESEVETYDMYCQGQILCYDIQDKNGDTIDSLSGMYGDTEYAMAEAKSAIDYLSK